VRREIKEVENGNYLFDNVEILHVSSKNFKCPIVDTISLNNIYVDFAHDYVKVFWDLSPYGESVLFYIAGYVCKKIYSRIDCLFCKSKLLGISMSLLSAIKNRGSYLIPAPNVCSICQITEKIIRQDLHCLNTKHIKEIIFNNIFQKIPFGNDDMLHHIMSQDILDNHRTQLCESIITMHIFKYSIIFRSKRNVTKK